MVPNRTTHPTHPGVPEPLDLGATALLIATNPIEQDTMDTGQGEGTIMETTAISRRDYVRAVVTAAQLSGEFVAPWRALGDVDRHFDDEADLLAELHREWVRILVGKLHYGGLVSQRTPAEVREVYHDTCRDHPTLRSILDAHAAEPALWEPTSREHAMVARVAGLVNAGGPVEEAAAVGRALVARSLPAQRLAVPV
ncbi:MAG: hypothetical protein QOK15_2736 [Nocardioidaceae bacterium]|nr:hypothetical protein [Nocardioidaceae bacterium]